MDNIQENKEVFFKIDLPLPESFLFNEEEMDGILLGIRLGMVSSHSAALEDILQKDYANFYNMQTTVGDIQLVPKEASFTR